MANPLRKTMVYLGLADEELEYDEQEQRQEQRQQPPQAAQPAARQSSAAHASPVAPVPAPAPAPAATRAPVTPLRRSSTSTSKNTVPHDMNEILTVHPREY